jgi:hypothetical protein
LEEYTIRESRKEMKFKLAIATALILAMILIASLSISPVKASWVPQWKINNAIAKGLEYLNSTQTRSADWTNGSWDPYYYGGIASTALSVLCFENDGHLPSNLTDPYSEVVRNGLDFLLSQVLRQNIELQTHGDPDSNHNGYGLYVPAGENYELGMVIMALVGSGDKSRIATPLMSGRTFIAEVSGRTYGDIVTDMVDFISWAQCDGDTGRGGWRYWVYDNSSGSADNSVSPWNELGLHTAELWGINAPPFVKTELETYWLAYSQNPSDGGFGYSDPSYSYISDTAGGIIGLDYCGVSTSDARIVNATKWLADHWLDSSGWNTNFGNLYAMYNIMKACRLAIPPITFIGTQDWYNEYADALVGNQTADGHWTSWVYNWASDGVNTDFAILILQPAPVVVKYTLTVKVTDTNNNPIPGALVQANGPTSKSDTTDGGQVLFVDMQAGNYLVTASKTGYDPNSASIFLSTDMTITIKLTPSIGPRPVGGYEIPTDNIKTYAPLIALGSVISLVAVALVRRKKKNE